MMYEMKEEILSCHYLHMLIMEDFFLCLVFKNDLSVNLTN